MYAVYVLQDEIGRMYKGCTGDLHQRLKDHSSGRVRTTARMGKLSLVHVERFSSFAEARAREVYLKSSAGRRFLNGILRP